MDKNKYKDKINLIFRNSVWYRHYYGADSEDQNEDSK